MDEKNGAENNLSLNDFRVLCGAFVIFIVLGILRSMGWSMTSPTSTEGSAWIASVGYVLLTILFLVMIWIAQSSARATYWLGASAALGVFPSMPKLPFLQDVTHVALILFVAANWRNLKAMRFVNAIGDSRLKSYMVYLLVAGSSVVFNFLSLGNIWQLKVGLSALFLLFVFFIVIYQIAAEPTLDVFGQLLKGFLDSAQIAAVLGAIVLVLLLVTSSMGITGDGPDAVWGLGYSTDRLKLLFDGPGVAGSYFVVAMSFAIVAFSINGRSMEKWRGRGGLLFLIHIAPWLVVASGSRVARMALIALILTGLLCRPVRRILLIALPSSLIALMVMLDFQSFPGAARFSIDHVLPGVYSNGQNLEGLRLGSRFFEWEQRGDLLHQACVIFKELPLINRLLGMGHGVAGYRTSPYPSPHDQYFDLLIEVGLCGFLAYFAFWLTSSRRVIACLLHHRSFASTIGWAFCASVISIVGLSVAYEINTKGIVLVLLLLIFSWPYTFERSSNG
jgi:hypothetical protein